MHTVPTAVRVNDAISTASGPPTPRKAVAMIGPNSTAPLSQYPAKRFDAVSSRADRTSAGATTAYDGRTTATPPSEIATGMVTARADASPATRTAASTSVAVCAAYTAASERIGWRPSAMRPTNGATRTAGISRPNAVQPAAALPLRCSA